MNLYLSLTLNLLIAAIAFESLAAGEALVEVKSWPPQDLPYKERRKSFGMNIELSQIKYLPVGYDSIIDGAYYEDMFQNRPLPISQGEIGARWNNPLGSFSLSVVYGQGQIYGNLVGNDRNLIIKKYGSELSITFDNLAKEPYLAPYLGISAFRFDIEERNPFFEFVADTGLIYGYRVGALIQLNFLESELAYSAYREWGLENTYLDLFVAKNIDTDSPLDAGFATDFDLGFGLRLEF